MDKSQTVFRHDSYREQQLNVKINLQMRKEGPH